MPLLFYLFYEDLLYICENSSPDEPVKKAHTMPIMIVNAVGARHGAYFYIVYSIAIFLFMVPDAISTSLFVEGSHRQPLKASAMK